MLRSVEEIGVKSLWGSPAAFLLDLKQGDCRAFSFSFSFSWCFSFSPVVYKDSVVVKPWCEGSVGRTMPPHTGGMRVRKHELEDTCGQRAKVQDLRCRRCALGRRASFAALAPVSVLSVHVLFIRTYISWCEGFMEPLGVWTDAGCCCPGPRIPRR